MTGWRGEADAGIPNLEAKLPIPSPQRDRRVRAWASMLGDVLERLEAGEVDRDLHVLRVATNPGRLYLDRGRRASSARRSASIRPHSESNEGYMPRASDRTSSRASSISLPTGEQALGAAGSSLTASAASSSRMRNPTRCCWTPSWRSRSNRLRSAAAMSITRSPRRPDRRWTPRAGPSPSGSRRPRPQPGRTGGSRLAPGRR